MAKITAPVKRALKYYGLATNRINWRQLAETLASEAFPPPKKRGRRVKWTKGMKKKIYFEYCRMQWDDKYINRPQHLSKSATALALSKNKLSIGFGLSPERIRKLIVEGDKAEFPEFFKS